MSGAAFPGQPRDSDGMPCAEHEYGLTKREWFAGMALQGLLASGKWDNTGTGFEAYIALHAFNVADAMLSESDCPQ